MNPARRPTYQWYLPNKLIIRTRGRVKSASKNILCKYRPVGRSVRPWGRMRLVGAMEGTRRRKERKQAYDLGATGGCCQSFESYLALT